jgi:hypothetical protein
MYPGAELGPSVASSPRSPVTGCVPPGSPCSPDYYCLQPMPFMPGARRARPLRRSGAARYF